ncbi:MAG: JAB domain-containing protein, partial [Lysinibacillus sp.]
LNYSEISFGKIDEVAIDYASILKTALLSNAKQIVIGHNHPSNILKPSETDIEMTKKIAGLCNIFGIKLIDSIIVVPSGDYLSIRTYISKS